jgi:hypothetical protein
MTMARAAEMSRTASFIRAVRALRTALFGPPSRKCGHVWEVVQTINTYGAGKTKEDSYPIKVEYIQQCKKCGEIKKFTT